MTDRDKALVPLHDIHSDCPGFVATGTCDGLCGWMEGYRRAYDAGRAAERSDVMAWLHETAESDEVKELGNGTRLAGHFYAYALERGAHQWEGK